MHEPLDSVYLFMASSVLGTAASNGGWLALVFGLALLFLIGRDLRNYFTPAGVALQTELDGADLGRCAASRTACSCSSSSRDVTMPGMRTSVSYRPLLWESALVGMNEFFHGVVISE